MDNGQRERLDLTTVREKLATQSGQEYWRSLEELAETQEFREFLEDEFPNQTRGLLSEMDRRQFLMLGAASLALAGLSGCRYQPDKKAVPFVIQPEEWVAGVPLQFATQLPFLGYAQGALARSNEGRPTKIEGNPDHPDSQGAADVFMQAAILSLYDPDRSQNVRVRGELTNWDAFLAAARPSLEQQRAKGGVGLRILTETTTSLSFAAQMAALMKAFPQAKWYQYEPAGRDNVRQGANHAFGRIVNTVYHFDKADRICSLDADFLYDMPGHLRHARDFMQKRRVRKETQEMNRLYMVESAPTITGAVADHRFPVRGSEVEGIAYALANGLGVNTGSNRGDVARLTWLQAMITDLQAHKGKSLVVAGEAQPPSVHALAHAINAALGNVGTTVTYTEALEAGATNQIAGLRELTQEMEGGKVEVLLILGGNPVYTAPVDLNFADQLTKVPLSIHLSITQDETSARSQWHVPESHPLETWGDALATDGTLTLQQPLLSPLYTSKSGIEMIEALLNGMRSDYEIVHETFRTVAQGRPTDGKLDYEKTWQTWVHDGLIKGSAAPTIAPALKADFVTTLPPPQQKGSGLEIQFRPDPCIWDGRFSNNGWLQELPKPISKITWENAALISAATAERLKLSNEDLVDLHYKGRTVQAPLWIVPAHPDEAITVYLGYGRTQAGVVGNKIGFNAYALRTSDALYHDGGLELKGPRGRAAIATTQHHHSMEDRKPVQVAFFEEFRKNPTLAEAEAAHEEHPVAAHEGPHAGKHDSKGFYNNGDHDYPKNPADPNQSFGAYQWGMSIDTNACIGCNACVMGCQAENNIPIVGKDQVLRGREMQWIRIDRYYKFKEGNKSEDLPDKESDPRTPIPNFKPDAVETYFQPVTCMHCETAPCEPVCPVAATIHSQEGLNQMVYNRCIGTKYCSNNCPYKVRRFNFYKYVAAQPNPGVLNGNYDSPIIQLSANPDVTLRGRGVMEKCTYCVQRINRTRIEAKKEGREIKEGEVLTACQQTCPTQAISFGNIRDKEAEVSKQKAEPHSYGLLTDLNTNPRTTYLAKLRNPNPEIVG